MFSLIITIISIALVAVLALATLYYGGDAFNKGTADAQAAKIVNQGQQLLGAAELFRADAANAGVVMTIPELVSRGYLKSVPVAYQGNGSVNEAWAATEWTMPVADQPVFVAPVDAAGACKAVNKRTIGMDGILEQAHTSVITQCYGASTTTLKAVVGKNSAAFAAVVAEAGDAPGLPDADIVSAAMPAVDATSGWLGGYEPTVTAASGGSGGSGGAALNSPSPGAGSFTIGAATNTMFVPLAEIVIQNESSSEISAISLELTAGDSIPVLHASSTCGTTLAAGASCSFFVQDNAGPCASPSPSAAFKVNSSIGYLQGNLYSGLVC